MQPHRIRLHEPWTREPLDGGGFRLLRRFNLPTNLDEGEAVWLVCDRPPAGGVIGLNGANLGTFATDAAAWSADVTRLLVAANQLTIDLPTQSGSVELPWGEVRLEIRIK